MDKRVFISYRRSDSEWAAPYLAEALRLRLPEDQVFIDYATIPPGETFADYIRNWIASCDIVLVVIGRRWLSELHERLNKPEPDYVRMEIGLALTTHKIVIPVLLEEAPVPTVDVLPGDLQGLPDRNAHRIRVAHRKEDLEALLQRLGLEIPTYLLPSTAIHQFMQPGWLQSEQPQLTDVKRTPEVGTLHQYPPLNVGDLSRVDEVSKEGRDDVGRDIDVDIRELRSGSLLKAGDFLSERYKLVEELGRGGFATVWKAHDRTLDQFVAVKILHGQHTQSEDRVERFFRGSRYMHQLQHPHIVRVLEEKAEASSYFYFVMELLAGGDLKEAIKGGLLTTDVLLDHTASIAQALSCAHEKGIVHRDVKPANILLTYDGTPKLTDFDLVRAGDTTGGTRTGALGSVIYAAPEAIKNANKASPASDVYGLAMTTVVGLLNEVPEFEDKFQPDALCERLKVAPKIVQVLKDSLQIKPDKRPSNAGVFLERLQEARRRSSLPDGFIRPDWAASIERDEFGIFTDVLVGSQVSLRMRWIAPGTFLMGSSDSEQGRWKGEGPQHKVTLTQGFWLSDTPCTQAVYEAVIGTNPSQFKGAERPVELVSWDDAQAFLQALNKHLGDAPFSLPTEAQWEYACRAGTTSAHYGELNAIAWYDSNAGGETHAVRQKQANAWGLYDMLGNVWEWCADAMHRYAPDHAYDPIATHEGTSRVLRGGSWGRPAQDVRAAYRKHGAPSKRYELVGFRLARCQSAPSSRQGPQGQERQGQARTAKGGQRPSGAALACSSEGSKPRRTPPPSRPRPTSRQGDDQYGRFVDVILPARQKSAADASFRMRWIAPGTFLMGSPDSERGWGSKEEGPQHKVTLTQGFWLSDTPCTQAVYEAVIGMNPSRFTGANRPVEEVSWDDAQAFLQALNKRLGGMPLSLPTEAQWEYACRAGTTAARYGELDAIAWYYENAGGKTHTVRQKQANAWGLYDMLGNVWEWCADAMHRYAPDHAYDPIAMHEGTRRVLRGGSWSNLAQYVRAASRSASAPALWFASYGFRLARGH